jgi:hypothetical protein
MENFGRMSKKLFQGLLVQQFNVKVMGEGITAR